MSTNLLIRIAELEALAEKATPGPWLSGDWSGRCHLNHSHGRDACKYDYTLNPNWKKCVVMQIGETHVNIVTTTEEYGALSDENSEFIAASRTAIPELCSALREQIKKNEEQSNVVRELVDCLRLYDLLGINAALDEGHAARALLAKLGISPDGGKDGED